MSTLSSELWDSIRRRKRRQVEAALQTQAADANDGLEKELSKFDVKRKAIIKELSVLRTRGKKVSAEWSTRLDELKKEEDKLKDSIDTAANKLKSKAKADGFDHIDLYYNSSPEAGYRKESPSKFEYNCDSNSLPLDVELKMEDAFLELRIKLELADDSNMEEAITDFLKNDIFGSSEEEAAAAD